MAELGSLQACSKFTPVPIVRGWDPVDLSLGWLRRRAAERRALLGEERATSLARQQIPESWDGCTFILPRTAHWFFCGLVPRRFVAAMRKVDGEWQLLYRSVSGGFGREDYFLAEIS